MFQRNYAASTANTYISALGYSHRLAGVHDPTKVFWVIEMLKTWVTFRHSIAHNPSYPSLHFATICGSDYRRYLFTAMCTTAFFGFLRIGEITYCPRSSAMLQLDQVGQPLDNSCNIVGFKLTFKNFKHSYNQRAVSITLNQRSDVCPVQSLLAYLSRRGFSNGPLFCTEDGRAVLRKIFTDHLALIFRTCGLDPAKYKGHSFRIGAATLAAENGFSDAQIRLLGRWKSNAFHKYIRSQGLRTSIVAT